jgi:succinate-acetate transporter protein
MSSTSMTERATRRDDPTIVHSPAMPETAIADPAPLGLAAFAMTTLILSLSNTNTWAAGVSSAVALALAYGGGAQLLAGMWEFKRNNTFGATAFTSFGAFWIAYWYLSAHILPGIEADQATAGDVPVIVGTFLLGWCVFTAYMTIASLRVSGAVAMVFVLLTITFVFLTIGAFQESTALTKTGGWFGVATAAAAWYASFAGVTNSTFKRVVLPTFPLEGRGAVIER